MSVDNTWHNAMWKAIGRGLTAHAVMLRDTAIVDDSLAASLLTAIDATSRGNPPKVAGSLGQVAAFDERTDSLIAPGAIGSSRIARARHDLAATAQRLVLRDRLLALAEALNASRADLLDLAENHVFTLMPVWSQGNPLQPTNFAHFLTGTTAPLTRAARRLQAAYADLDRSPLGAAVLAGPGMPIDRDETADLLGSEGPVESTFDAVSSVDHLVETAAAAAASVSPVRRLEEELLSWLRVDSQAIRLAPDPGHSTDANLPHFRPPEVWLRLISEGAGVVSDAATIAAAANDVAYGPTGDATDRVTTLLGALLAAAASIHEEFAALLGGSIEINRAWLAREAGRGLVTSGDLADFLMAEESLDPSAAREISALTASRALQEGLEASAITPAMIDAAALAVIGREIGIEIERLGAYLAPRRFIEKRTVLGGPAPSAIREYLAVERIRLADDQRWLEQKRRRIALAEENLDIRTHEILAAASTG